MKHARGTAIAASFAVATLASGLGASSIGASSGVASLRFYERSGATHVIDNAPKGKQAGRGDLVLYANPIFDRQGTQVEPTTVSASSSVPDSRSATRRSRCRRPRS